jgi:hypothetical protein
VDKVTERSVPATSVFVRNMKKHRPKRTFSRWMPPVRPRTVTPLGWAVLAALVVVIACVIALLPVTALLFAAAAVVFLLSLCADERNRRRTIAAERAGEDIGSFARGFNRRAEPFDPWVVRATWDALWPYVASPGGGGAPLRASDRLLEDLRIDPEDVEDMLAEVAERAGYSLERVEANPLFGQVVTVGDFVRLVTAQPRLASERGASPSSTAPSAPT